MSIKTENDLAYVLTSAGLRIFALWIFITYGLTSFYWLLNYFEVDSGLPSPAFKTLPLFLYGSYLLISVLIWVNAPRLAYKFVPHRPQEEAPIGQNEFIEICLAAIGVFLIGYSIPDFLSVTAQALWNFTVAPTDQIIDFRFWKESVAPIGRVITGLILIRARFPIGQWLLKLRGIYAD